MSNGAPGVTRTRNHPLRRRVLYPVELRGQSFGIVTTEFKACCGRLEPLLLSSVCLA